MTKFRVHFIKICQFTWFSIVRNKRWALNAVQIVCHWEGLAIFGFFRVFRFMWMWCVWYEYDQKWSLNFWDGEFIFVFQFQHSESGVNFNSKIKLPTNMYLVAIMDFPSNIYNCMLFVPNYMNIFFLPKRKHFAQYLIFVHIYLPQPFLHFPLKNQSHKEL